LAADAGYIDTDYIKVTIRHNTQCSNSTKSHWSHHKNVQKYPTETAQII